MKQTKSIDHINIVVSNLEEAEEFYKLLGFKTVHHASLKGEWIDKVVGIKNIDAKYVKMSLAGEKTDLELIQYYSPVGEKQPTISKANQIGLRHIAFEVDDIEAEVERLEKKGVKFMSKVCKYPDIGKELIYFYGPDGIILELAKF